MPTTLDPHEPFYFLIKFLFYTCAFRLDYYLTILLLPISTSLVRHIASTQLTNQPNTKPTFKYDFTISHALCKYS